MRRLEHRIPPPLVMLLMAAGMWLLAYLPPSVAIDRVLRINAAGACGIAAGFLTTLGFWAFGRAHTTIDPVRIEAVSRLVTSGVYRLSRNPMYLSLALLLCAWGVYLAQPWVVMGPITFVVFITRFQIEPEERILRARFGVAYDRYCSEVRRWI